ncbi:MAG: sugar ABC transporter permease [Caldilineaceae bacterium]
MGSVGRRRRSGLAREEMRDGYLMVGFWLVGFLIFTAGPILASMGLSFTAWDLIADPKWAGWSNYRTLLKDDLIHVSLWNTLYFTAVLVPLSTIGALLLALAMNLPLRGIRLYRTLYYLPSITPAVATTLLWLLIFQPEFGVANYLLRQVGLPKQLWLMDPDLAKPILILIALWGVGGSIPIFLAGLQAIPPELYEAAEIDGSNRWNSFRRVTLPLLTPVIFFSVITGIIGSFQVFTSAYIATDGGPENATLFYVLLLYRNAFQYFKMGYASAMAWLLFVIVLLFTILQFRLARHWVHYEV